MTDNVPVISVTNLIKQFGRFAALRGVTAEFAAGKLYAILGDNGAGKTTLLRTLAGLNHPSSGSVTILGTTRLHDICREVGYMAHPSLLYDEMSGMENLAYFARLYGLGDGVADRKTGGDRSADVIRAVGLDPDLTRPVGQYSQGMRQRTSLARVLLPVPELLLLDEPFSNMDVESARQMVELLAGFRQGNRTIVITTHQLDMAAPIADFVLSLRAGRVASLEPGRPTL